LRGLTKLKTFTASANQIEVIPPSLFQDSLELEVVNFSNNEIKSIKWTVFCLLEQLSNFNLINNIRQSREEFLNCSSEDVAMIIR
jgi:Leucine-rich repeat (LRR) protein